MRFGIWQPLYLCVKFSNVKTTKTKKRKQNKYLLRWMINFNPWEDKEY